MKIINELNGEHFHVATHGIIHYFIVKVGEYENSDVKQEFKEALQDFANSIYNQAYARGLVDGQIKSNQ